MKLVSVETRMYAVGFGDCFLLSFHYSGKRSRHVLIDFGTTAYPSSREHEILRPVAEDIARRTSGKLTAVVATHRHRDHIGGFAPHPRATAPGAIIAALKPSLVVQPWTENPLLGDDARHPAPIPRAAVRAGFREEWMAMARNNLPNRPAIRHLEGLGGESRYVYAGQRSGLEDLLPGIRVDVLGPLSPRQAGRSKPARFWDREFAAAGPLTPLFPGFPAMRRWPLETRWLLNRIRDWHSDRILELTRAYDSDINNTSVVLAIRALGHTMIFPGDAETESWTGMLARRGTLDILRRATLLKASHHGSANGTPNVLWEALPREGLRVLLSTQGGVYGHNVPCANLLKRMRSEACLIDSRDYPRGSSVAVEFVAGRPPRKLPS
ncbi:MAG: MBL fold metallo-hydrolase [Bryobacteraceae bacterium]|nr:MBL fold metallo-hydrolase [Bryobacteraceae bacterium]